MVFSGIVQTTGNVKSIVPIGEDVNSGITLQIEPREGSFIDADVSLGCSIAVNGTCLTVTSFTSRSFTVDLAPETLRRTSFGEIKIGSPVNLEKALKMDDRNSGHTVQGHVDGVGIISNIVPDGSSLRVTISTRSLGLSFEERKYLQSLVVPKGFIAVDGASLTICEVNREEEFFTLMLIPHTQEVLKTWTVDDRVNIELDCLAKYVSATLRCMVDPVIEKVEKRIRRTEILTVSIGLLTLFSVYTVLTRR
jgi:riboflavin synthase